MEKLQLWSPRVSASIGGWSVIPPPLGQIPAYAPVERGGRKKMKFCASFTYIPVHSGFLSFSSWYRSKLTVSCFQFWYKRINFNSWNILMFQGVGVGKDKLLSKEEIQAEVKAQLKRYLSRWSKIWHVFNRLYYSYWRAIGFLNM